jgi:hypothetical protein
MFLWWAEYLTSCRFSTAAIESALIYRLPSPFPATTGDREVADITEYLRGKIAEFRFARFIGEIVWAIGSSIAIGGLFFNVLLLALVGFLMLFIGLYLSVHFELQRLDYTHALESFAHREK